MNKLGSSQPAPMEAHWAGRGRGDVGRWLAGSGKGGDWGGSGWLADAAPS